MSFLNLFKVSCDRPVEFSINLSDPASSEFEMLHSVHNTLELVSFVIVGFVILITMAIVFTFSYERILKRFEKELKRGGLKYVRKNPYNTNTKRFIKFYIEMLPARKKSFTKNSYILLTYHNPEVRYLYHTWVFFSKMRKFTHHDKLEFAWTLIPMFILFFLMVPSIFLLYTPMELNKPEVAVKVIGHQWFWEFEVTTAESYVTHQKNDLPLGTKLKTLKFESYMKPYNSLEPGELRTMAVDNPLYLPAFTNVRFYVTSADVIHSFCVPSLGIKVDGIPGRLNKTDVFLKRFGSFYGHCSEICGVGHGFMPINVRVIDPTDYLEIHYLASLNNS